MIGMSFQYKTGVYYGLEIKSATQDNYTLLIKLNSTVCELRNITYNTLFVKLDYLNN